jgi:lipopolysaccharide export system protein LptA
MAWQSGGDKTGRARLLWGARMLVPLTIALLASPAGAQTPVAGFSGISGDNSKKPIDIESDRLEVDDKKQMATFIGNVSATQGDYNLRARLLEVTYEKGARSETQQTAASGGSKAGKASKTANANAPADPLSSGQIKFIHATGGKVLVTSKKDEQEATGDEAFFDVKAQKITMTGEEVILTQKKNIVKGNKLLIDLATGRATLETKGRVQAKFEQESGKGLGANPFTAAKKKTNTTDKEPGKPPAADSGWLTQSR